MICLEPRRFWVTPRIQQLLSRSIVTRARPGGGVRIAFEARLNVSGLAALWGYESTPSTPHTTGALYSTNALVLGIAAAAGSVLLQDRQGASDYPMLLAGAVFAPPQPLPSLHTLPGGRAPVLLAAVSTANGNLTVELDGRRQCQCKLGVLNTRAGADLTSVSSLHRLARRTTALFQEQLTACSALHDSSSTMQQAPPLSALVEPSARLQQLQAAVATLVPGNKHVSPDQESFALHPGALEAGLQTCMLLSAGMLASGEGGASALWLSAVQSLSVPPPAAVNSISDKLAWTAAHFAHAKDGTTCHVRDLHATAGPGACLGFSLQGALLAVDAAAAAEAGAARDIMASAPAADSSATAAAQAAAAAAAIAAVSNPLLGLDDAERSLYLQAQIMAEVHGMLGHTVHPDEPIMASGLDSRAAMELRATLAEQLGVSLPVTLLYDAQVSTHTVLCAAALARADNLNELKCPACTRLLL